MNNIIIKINDILNKKNLLKLDVSDSSPIKIRFIQENHISDEIFKSCVDYLTTKIKTSKKNIIIVDTEDEDISIHISTAITERIELYFHKDDMILEKSIQIAMQKDDDVKVKPNPITEPKNFNLVVIRYNRKGDGFNVTNIDDPIKSLFDKIELIIKHKKSNPPLKIKFIKYNILEIKYNVVVEYLTIVLKENNIISIVNDNEDISIYISYEQSPQIENCFPKNMDLDKSIQIMVKTINKLIFEYQYPINWKLIDIKLNYIEPNFVVQEFDKQKLESYINQCYPQRINIK